MADHALADGLIEFEPGFCQRRPDEPRKRLAAMADELARVSEAADHAAERARLHAMEAAALRKMLASEQAHVQALQESTCWRITFPVRAVADAWHRCVATQVSRLRAKPTVTEAAVPADPRARPALHMPPPAFPLQGEICVHPALGETPPLLLQTVSVIIPTLNAGVELAWLIRRLQAQSGIGGVQIVIVDSGSTDGTPDLAAGLGCRVLPIDRGSFSHSAARNLGAQAANGDLLLFMVQDAYPIGETWLAGLATALLHPQGEPLAAVSCAEFSRTDSELVYDAMARMHYQFVGCAEQDRVGRLTGLDHAELRRQGQLSDVACMIPRALFAQYGFRGRYAEDLLLGLRLIKDGHAVGMLSSIRVVHSHCRPASYYVRRTFVDVVFLAAAFADFDIPPANLPVGTLMASFVLQAAMPILSADPMLSAAEMLDRVVERLREVRMPMLGRPLPARGDFGFAPLGEWMARLLRHAALVGRPLPPTELRAARQLQATAVARLEALRPFVAQAWPVADETAVAELSAAVEKTLAMSLGVQLGFCHVQPFAVFDPVVQDMLDELKPLLLEGI